MIKQLDLGSALAVRLTKITGKSRVPIHPKHLLTQKPWFITYLKKSDVVLDLGCGSGQNAIKASRIANRVVACDFDKELLNIAEEEAKLKKINNIKFEIVNLEERLKYRNNSFSSIIFLDVLEHLKNRDEILSGIKRVLKPDGLLFLGVPNSQTSWKKLQRSSGVCSFSDPDHKVEFTQKQIESLLEKFGFKIIHLGYSSFDTPLRGLIDIIGSFSLTAYKFLTYLRIEAGQKNPQETSGFQIVAQNV